MNESESKNLEAGGAHKHLASENSTSTNVKPKCSCRYRGFRLALYSLVAVGLLGNVAARAAPEWMGSAADFVQNHVLIGAASPTQECSGCVDECGKTTFVFEGTSGLPCSGNDSCSVDNCEGESCLDEEATGDDQAIATESDNLDETKP
ncbi:hypothetical protein Pla52o_22290 [Novipirellula galeiformis]|uniref:Uncharacterized protein n=1 Tax=Novipirellula galeiformis TaxID=2528004 RepID=A0A5C6CIZ9_9BACT|nr:hypothetical protein [Novipirellula galeiformis]TWU24302.1 hypothetical protein Pla52o_22290 [Novipirellula galeiformis]